MTKENTKIVFMGTPEFAVESLRALIDGGFNVVGVVTATDKPAGRGQKLQFSAIKKYALEHNLPILQPENLKDEIFLSELKSWHADLFVVVAFRMLPETLWAMPRLGTFNLHASLLPQYRGAAPINRAIINGERETGVTTFFIAQGMDTGNIILQEKMKIEPADNAGTLHDKLMTLGGKLVQETVKQIVAGTVKTLSQNLSEKVTPAPKIFKETCRINWSLPAEKVHNLVRGLSPYPAAFTELLLQNGEKIMVKIFETNYQICQHHYVAGQVVKPSLTSPKEEDGLRKRFPPFGGIKEGLPVAVPDGFVYLQTLQPAGKKPMSAGDFLRGYQISG